jgi:hypothetical protein
MGWACSTRAGEEEHVASILGSSLKMEATCSSETSVGFQLSI